VKLNNIFIDKSKVDTSYLLGKSVEVIVARALGSVHPSHQDIIYPFTLIISRHYTSSLIMHNSFF